MEQLLTKRRIIMFGKKKKKEAMLLDDAAITKFKIAVAQVFSKLEEKENEILKKGESYYVRWEEAKKAGRDTSQLSRSLKQVAEKLYRITQAQIELLDTILLFKMQENIIESIKSNVNNLGIDTTDSAMDEAGKRDDDAISQTIHDCQLDPNATPETIAERVKEKLKV